MAIGQYELCLSVLFGSVSLKEASGSYSAESKVRATIRFSPQV